MNTLLKLSFLNSPTRLVLTLVAALIIYSHEANATTSFAQINLVTDDQSANSAQITDTSLKNPWGLSFGTAGPFWVSDNATGVSTLFNVSPTTQKPTKLGLTVAIPGAGNVTGQVFNNSTGFNGDAFLFVSEDGTVSGWRGALGTTAETLVTSSASNLYKGAAIASFGGNSYLYAANFNTGAVDVLKGSPGAQNLAGTFTDPNLPSGFSPFNIQALGDKLYVAYALKDSASPDEVAGAGLGMVSVFDLQGNLEKRLVTGGALNAPWGLAIAPSSFGEFAGDLLVGNFGDGTINAYNLINGSLVGQLKDSNGQVLKIDGLWALSAGNGGSAGSSQAIYFTAGPGDEAHGLFGAITVVPLPAAFWLFGSALLGFRVFGKPKKVGLLGA
ncbi:hypothetical protein [Methylomonas albis]|uniref:TIGR03118 family protein n=1 Tax=Methylomonas albis TaxID=1854563 RepID=A0ABR9D4W1_9GAMM|nr:TIGR03118 family protein [Methylomonas albis]MBD9358156.1 TIGR03118 family protein [Methylomonas albis]CAD6881528.1 hypothetical protein [Methylomonas albis]